MVLLVWLVSSQSDRVLFTVCSLQVAVGQVSTTANFGMLGFVGAVCKLLNSTGSPGTFSCTTPRRMEGGRTSLHESTSVCPIIHPILLYQPTLHPFTCYISPLNRLNLLYIFLHYPHKHKNTFLLGIYTVTHNHAYCIPGVFNWFCPRDHHSE